MTRILYVGLPTLSVLLYNGNLTNGCDTNAVANVIFPNVVPSLCRNCDLLVFGGKIQKKDSLQTPAPQQLLSVGMKRVSLIALV